MVQQLDSRSCFVCGIDNSSGLRLIFQHEQDRVWASFQPRVEHQGWPGFVHNGILMTILDETLVRAATLASVQAMTGRLEVRFRQPAPLDQQMVVTGMLKAEDGDSLEIEGFIQLGDGSLVAEARGIYMRLSEELRDALQEQVSTGA